MDPGSEQRLRRFVRSTLALMGERPAKLDGELHVAGLDRSVEIFRDGFGIPHIRASTDHDAFFGLGFCHGQDRATQLELSLRAVRGTLAEVAGADGLDLDRLARRIGFRRAAEAQLATMRPEIQAQLAAYAEGINAGATRGLSARPHELSLLGCDPTPWQAADVQAVSVILCFALAANWDVELLRYEMLRRDGADAVRALDAPYPGDMPVNLPPLAAPEGPSPEERLLDDLGALRDLFPLGGASNAWAVMPARTRHGRPILAADPHLPPDIPVHWYLAHLTTPELRVSGATFVGIPGFGIGHNEHCAWAVTAAHADNTDFFVEELGPDGASVREGDRFEPCRVREESIRVKGRREPERLRVLETRRGPIVAPALAGATGPSSHSLSLSATWLAARPYTGLYLAHRARSQEAFHELFREASTSSVNVVYADREGHVAWRLGVEVPIRTSGHGSMPRPGWEPGAGWSGELVPFEEMPSKDDPSCGFVASANNAPVDPREHGPFFGFDFLDGYRKKRLVHELGRRSDWDLAATRELQRDTQTAAWDDAREYLLGLDVSHPSARRAQRLLAGWDGRMSERSSGASVWAVASAKLMARVVRAKAPNTAARALGTGFHRDLPYTTMITRRTSHLMRLLRERPEGFLPEGWDAAAERALGEAVDELVSRFGPGDDRWGWGEARPLRLTHPMGKAVKALDLALGEGPLRFGGDATTLSQGTTNLGDPLGNPLGVPNLRVTIDVGAWENSRFALLAGQSGNPLSPHYFDQLAAWRGEGLPIAWTLEAARASAVHRLVLR